MILQSIVPFYLVLLIFQQPLSTGISQEVSLNSLKHPLQVIYQHDIQMHQLHIILGELRKVRQIIFSVPTEKNIAKVLETGSTYSTFGIKFCQSPKSQFITFSGSSLVLKKFVCYFTVHFFLWKTYQAYSHSFIIINCLRSSHISIYGSHFFNCYIVSILWYICHSLVSY